MATTERMGVDPLAVIRAHAESHRSLAAADAYSAQEAPKLEAALAAVAELVDGAAKANVALRNYRLTGKPDYEALTEASDALDAALSPFSEAGR